MEHSNLTRTKSLIDKYGRRIDYLRVSVTDRCNLRCQYCIPKDGIELTTHEEILSFNEIYRICSLMGSMGIHKIKLTGGEPLARKNLNQLVKQLKSIPEIDQITLTTNGVLLEEQVEGLVEAGIDAITVSMDTLDSNLYAQITRRDEFTKAMNGLKAAYKYVPNIAVKINCVPMGLEGQNLVEMAAIARDYNIHVRYIEMMPIGLGKQFTMCSEEDVLKELEAVYGKASLYNGKLGNGPCHYYTFKGFKGKIGFISAVSHKFCSECNRVRLTSQGFLKTCLQYDIGSDLRGLIRSGCSDEKLLEVISKTIDAKPDGHRFLKEEITSENHLGMSQIGG
ncbi:Molybdenum cofactor biosynthesis protein MoaA [Lachnospiraceae bacterium TWA4]|nr:Molybdenum cofactor biosynthesis protein MoaA [Lachnospiraceae bacterium TWA4]